MRAREDIEREDMRAGDASGRVDIVGWLVCWFVCWFFVGLFVGMFVGWLRSRTIPEPG